MNVFTAHWFKIGEIGFSFVNFILLGFIFICTIILVKIVRKNLNKWLNKYVSTQSEKTIAIKEEWKTAIIRLSKQIIIILAFFLAIKSLEISNNVSEVSSILEFKIISFPNFHLAIYHIFLVIAVVFCTKILINIVNVIVTKRLSKNENVDKGTEYVIIQLAKYIIYIIAFAICIRSFVHNMTILLTSSAALLAAIGLGLQDLFKDIVAGFILLFENTVKVGDIVEIKSKQGLNRDIAKVLKINLRTIKIQTRDGNVLILPNNKFTQNVIRNWSFGDKISRFHIPLTIHYKSNVELVKKLLIQSAYAHPKVYKTKDIFVRLNNFGNNGLELELIFWAKQTWDIELVTSDIRYEIDRLFREHNIDIPYPQLSINNKKRNQY